MKSMDKKNLLLITDSLSSLEAISDTSSKNAVVRQIQNCLWEMYSKMELEIVLAWKPSHCGIARGG